MTTRKSRIAHAVGSFVRTRYETAKSAKSELHDALVTCVRLLKNETTPDDDGVDIGIQVVAPMVRGVKSLLRDVLGNTSDWPFTIAATPIPDLPEHINERLALEVQRRLADIDLVTGGDDAAVEAFLGKMRNTALLMMAKQARQAAQNMERLVKDELQEAGWEQEFDNFLYNYVAYPFAVMKVPAQQIRRVKEWNGQRLTVNERVVRAVENLSPFDIFWSPGATSINTAEYVIERRRIGADELFGMLSIPTYDDRGIEKVLKKHPGGFVEPYEGSSSGNTPVLQETDDPVLETDASEVDYYDALVFHGKIKGEQLKEFDIDIEDERQWYEAEVWTIDDVPVRVALNPDPTGDRPYRVASYEALPGQINGTCPTLMLEDVQRMANASARALVRNMAMASGPIGEVDADRLADDDDPRIVYANQIRLVNRNRASQSDAPAYRFHSVNSHAGELLNVVTYFRDMAFERLGIPRVAFGGVEGLGTIGRTSGGVAMVLNQASKQLKDAIRNLEMLVVVPAIQSYVDYNLMFNEDPTIKGDIRVHARGVSGIVEREAQRDKLGWALQSITPLVSAQMVPQQAVLRLLYTMFQSHGIPTEGIFPDFDGEDALNQDLGIAQQPPQPQGGQFDISGVNSTPLMQSPMGGVPLDGRSGDAVAAIETANGGF